MNLIFRMTIFMSLMKTSLALIFSALLLHPVSSIAAKLTSPNFVIILSDDQSWVGSSIKMKPEDSQTKSDYFKTHTSNDWQNVECSLHKVMLQHHFAAQPAAACSLAKLQLATFIRKINKNGQVIIENS